MGAFLSRPWEWISEASLAVMARDAQAQRGDKPFVFANMKTGQGLPEIIAFIRREGLLWEG